MNGSQTAKPKPLFWLVVFLVVVGLIAFGAYRLAGWLGLFEAGSPLASLGVGTPDAANALEISFYTSDAKKKWVDEMVKAFNESNRVVDGRVVRVKAVHVLSGASLDDLKSGAIKPDMWSPGDESWLELAAAHWRAVKQKALFDEYQPLVNIPLVVAMWEPMARALGYPNKPLGWKDIDDLAASSQGWAARGHAEWGKFRWGHAHPDANSGFLAVLSLVYAAAGKTEGLSVADLKRPDVQEFLKSAEVAIEHYGLSNSWLDQMMRAKGPSYLSACVQYENTIIQSNEKSGNAPFKMVALYPKEGCFWTRHPVAILKEDWMTPEKEAACRAFIDYLLSEPAQRQAMKLGLRPISTEIALEAPFDEAHGVIAQVPADRAFRVPEEAVLQRVRELWEDVKVPATVIMVIDRSGSMRGSPMDNARAGAVQFVKSMKPRDALMLVVFNNAVSVLSEMKTIRESAEVVIAKLEGLFAEGGTALYDAVSAAYQSIQELKRQNPNRRYCLLVLSDGLDTASSLKLQDFLDQLPRGEDFDAPKVFSIAYGEEADKNFLTEIANRTNGRMFVSTPEEIQKTYKELSANF